MQSILVVDDNEDVRFLLESTLSVAGYRVRGAGGSDEALAALSEEVPDLLILDVQMPDRDGWDTLAALRADPATRRLRVIMCTVKGSPDNAERGWELGCDGYIPKPFHLDALVAEVRAVLNRREDERPHVRSLRAAAVRRLRVR